LFFFFFFLFFFFIFVANGRLSFPLQTDHFNGFEKQRECSRIRITCCPCM
jgi:hypothetical protein